MVEEEVEAVEEEGRLSMSKDKQSNGKADAYEDRNLAVLGWFKMIQENDLGTVGFYNDDDSEDNWVVLIAEIDGIGQISYHCPRSFAKECSWLDRIGDSVWDGHSREDKNGRIKENIWESYSER